MKKVCLVLGIIATLVGIIFVGTSIVQSTTYKPQNPIATIQIEGYEKPIKVELDPQASPNAVANFIKLVERGFYTNFKMHIEEDRILGDESMEMASLSNIMDYPDDDYKYGIKGDFLANGVENLLKHKKGVITMERNDYSYYGLSEEGYNSANCNFCILTQDIDNYNGYYAAFGEVIDGIDVLDAIAATRVEENNDNTETQESIDNTENVEDSNTNVITISSISVDTFGVDYGIPEVVNYEENMEKVNTLYNQYFGGSTTTEITED